VNGEGLSLEPTKATPSRRSVASSAVFLVDSYLLGHELVQGGDGSSAVFLVGLGGIPEQGSHFSGPEVTGVGPGCVEAAGAVPDAVYHVALLEQERGLRIAVPAGEAGD
jgi:hypothetical protein